jgi:hypothetical protein
MYSVIVYHAEICMEDMYGSRRKNVHTYKVPINHTNLSLDIYTYACTYLLALRQRSCIHVGPISVKHILILAKNLTLGKRKFTF